MFDCVELNNWGRRDNHSRNCETTSSVYRNLVSDHILTHLGSVNRRKRCRCCHTTITHCKLHNVMIKQWCKVRQNSLNCCRISVWHPKFFIWWPCHTAKWIVSTFCIIKKVFQAFYGAFFFFFFHNFGRGLFQSRHLDVIAGAAQVLLIPLLTLHSV